MRTRLFAAFLIGLCFCAPAMAQKSKAVMSTEITTNIPDQTTGAITPQVMRNTLTDMVNSWQQYSGVNAQTGVTYTVQLSDYGQLITFNNAGSIAVTLPQAIGSFQYFNFFASNIGTGTATITPGGGTTINGSPSFALAPGQSVTVISDGANYQIIKSGLTAGQFAGGTCITISGTITPTIGITNACVNTAQMANNAITNAILATITGPVIKGVVITTSAQTVSDLTPGQVGSILCQPVRTVIITGSGTYNTPTCNSILATWLEVELQGGGGGGSGSGTAAGSPGSGTAGNNSTFSTLTASGGGGGSNIAATGLGGAGGTCSGTLGVQQNFVGTPGTSAINSAALAQTPGGDGGSSFYGGAGRGVFNGVGGSAPLNSGGGGAGGGGNTTAGVFNAAGGGAGCHISTIITSVNTTYSYGIGALAGGGPAGTSGQNGGAGAAGLLSILAHWQ